ncbi:MAG TPA: acetoin utilization protein AcuC [Gammaproteobacteria bacterium]|nr:acetoin utilization protein AcuC [Gammaproteobacteria bacterium]
MPHELLLCLEDALARYSFPNNHPFGVKRLFAFRDRLLGSIDADRYGRLQCVEGAESCLSLFHQQQYIDWVKGKSEQGMGFLDAADTPAFPGVYEAASRVVGTVVNGVDRIMAGEARRVFVPIAGLHHARRGAASGFCVFNDCGVAIEYLRAHHGVRRIAYIDIDAHHGDGVYYEFEEDPDVRIVDFHEDGHFLYPGTGHEHETGKGEAEGTKMNIPLPMNADDEEFMALWPAAEAFIAEFEPEFILLQAGADAMAGDPVTDMAWTTAPYAHAAQRLRQLAERHCEGRMLVMGGGGYNLDNVASAWTEVVMQLV